MRLAIILASALVLAACSDGEVVEADPDYAAINDSARAPAEPITPDIIGYEDIEKHNLFGAGCIVLSADGEMVLIADAEAAHFLLNGELIRLLPHPGTDKLPYGTFAHYDGLAHAVELAVDEETASALSPELTTYDGRLTIRDERDRMVFDKASKVECGA